ARRDCASLPTRRSSDLGGEKEDQEGHDGGTRMHDGQPFGNGLLLQVAGKENKSPERGDDEEDKADHRDSFRLVDVADNKKDQGDRREATVKEDERAGGCLPLKEGNDERQTEHSGQSKEYDYGDHRL